MLRLGEAGVLLSSHRSAGKADELNTGLIRFADIVTIAEWISER
jgi:hypothetical protein